MNPLLHNSDVVHHGAVDRVARVSSMAAAGNTLKSCLHKQKYNVLHKPVE